MVVFLGFGMERHFGGAWWCSFERRTPRYKECQNQWATCRLRALTRRCSASLTHVVFLSVYNTNENKKVWKVEEKIRTMRFVSHHILKTTRGCYVAIRREVFIVQSDAFTPIGTRNFYTKGIQHSQYENAPSKDRFRFVHWIDGRGWLPWCVEIQPFPGWVLCGSWWWWLIRALLAFAVRRLLSSFCFYERSMLTTVDGRCSGSQLLLWQQQWKKIRWEFRFGDDRNTSTSLVVLINFIDWRQFAKVCLSHNTGRFWRSRRFDGWCSFDAVLSNTDCCYCCC